MRSRRGSAFAVRRSGFSFLGSRIRGSGFSVLRFWVLGFWVLALGCAGLLTVVSGFSRTVLAQSVDAEAVYQANCATCHDQPQGRTPSKDALKERTPDAILMSLTN